MAKTTKAPTRRTPGKTALRSTPKAETPTDNEPKMKRLTLDIPEELHRAIKLHAVQQGVSMVDELRTLLTEHYGVSRKKRTSTRGG